MALQSSTLHLFVFFFILLLLPISRKRELLPLLLYLLVHRVVVLLVKGTALEGKVGEGGKFKTFPTEHCGIKSGS